jgi:hypothetical protein
MLTRFGAQGPAQPYAKTAGTCRSENLQLLDLPGHRHTALPPRIGAAARRRAAAECTEMVKP